MAEESFKNWDGHAGMMSGSSAACGASCWKWLTLHNLLTEICQLFSWLQVSKSVRMCHYACSSIA